MWWVIKDDPKSFQDEFGPWQGIDYAQFSDPPNLAKDETLKSSLMWDLKNQFPHEFDSLEIRVKNGFVLLNSLLEKNRLDPIQHFLLTHDGVKEVIISHSQEENP